MSNKYFTGYRDVTEEAIREDARYDGAFGYSLPMFPPSPIEEAVKLAHLEATRATSAAVTSWAKQVGMTVEKWLEVYGARVELVAPEDGPAAEGLKVTMRVTAHLRGEPCVVFERRPA